MAGEHRLAALPGRISVPRPGQAPEFGGLTYAGELREAANVSELADMEPGHTGLIFQIGTCELGPVEPSNLWRIHHVTIDAPGGGMVRVYTDERTISNLFAEFPMAWHHGSHLSPPVEIRAGQSVVFEFSGVPRETMPEMLTGAIAGQIFLER